MELELVAEIPHVRAEFIDNILAGFAISGYFVRTKFDKRDMGDPVTYAILIYREKKQ